MADLNVHDLNNGRGSRPLWANPPVPGRKNPEPDQPAPPGREDDEAPLPDEDDAERHRPGRDERVTLHAQATCNTAPRTWLL